MMAPSKVIRFISNSLTKGPADHTRTMEEVIKESLIPYMEFPVEGGDIMFPMYRGKDVWARISSYKTNGAVTYKFSEGGQGEVTLDRDCNLLIRNYYYAQALESLRRMLTEVLYSYNYFCRIVKKMNKMNKYKIEFNLEFFESVYVDWQGLEEDKPKIQTQLFNWGFLKKEYITLASQNNLDLSDSDLFKSDGNKQILLSLMKDICFMIEGERFSPEYGRTRDRLRIKDESIMAIISEYFSGKWVD